MAVLVIKDPQPQRIQDFFERMLGVTFVAEKHGDGPEHVACQIGDDVLEVYPAKLSGMVFYLGED